MCNLCVCACVCDAPSLLVGNTPTGFMSEGDEQAPVPSGWWYDLSFCTSLLSAAALSHLPFQPGSEGHFLPPPSTRNTFLLPLTLCFVNLRKSVWSPLLLIDVEFVSRFHAGVPMFAFRTCSRVSPYIWKRCVKHLFICLILNHILHKPTVINIPLTIRSS